MKNLKILLKTKDSGVFLKDVVSLNWDEFGVMNMIKVNFTNNIHSLLLMRDPTNSGIFFNDSNTIEGKLIIDINKILEIETIYNKVNHKAEKLENLYYELKKFNQC